MKVKSAAGYLKAAEFDDLPDHGDWAEANADDDMEENLEDLDFDELKERLNITEDGLAVLNMYMKKFQGPHKVKETLEAFISDVEEYAMPAVGKLLDAL